MDHNKDSTVHEQRRRKEEEEKKQLGVPHCKGSGHNLRERKRKGLGCLPGGMGKSKTIIESADPSPKFTALAHPAQSIPVQATGQQGPQGAPNALAKIPAPVANHAASTDRGRRTRACWRQVSSGCHGEGKTRPPSIIAPVHTFYQGTIICWVEICSPFWKKNPTVLGLVSGCVICDVLVALVPRGIVDVHGFELLSILSEHGER